MSVRAPLKGFGVHEKQVFFVGPFQSPRLPKASRTLDEKQV